MPDWRHLRKDEGFLAVIFLLPLREKVPVRADEGLKIYIYISKHVLASNPHPLPLSRKGRGGYATHPNTFAQRIIQKKLDKS